METTIRTASFALQRAIEQNDFTRARQLLEQYSADVTAGWHAIDDPEERTRMAAEVLSFMQWAQRCTLIARTQLHEQSRQAARSLAYIDSRRRIQAVEAQG